MFEKCECGRSFLTPADLAAHKAAEPHTGPVDPSTIPAWLRRARQPEREGVSDRFAYGLARVNGIEPRL